MKRITSALKESLSYLEGGYTNGYDRLHPYFNSVGSYADDAGFELTGVGVHPIFTQTKGEFYPTLEVEVTEDNGIYYFNPILSMPTLKGDDMDYYDSMEYYADKLGRAAKLCSYLMKNPLDSNEWANSPEEEEEY